MSTSTKCFDNFRFYLISLRFDVCHLLFYGSIFEDLSFECNYENFYNWIDLKSTFEKFLSKFFQNQNQKSNKTRGENNEKIVKCAWLDKNISSKQIIQPEFEILSCESVCFWFYLCVDKYYIQ